MDSGTAGEETSDKEGHHDALSFPESVVNAIEELLPNAEQFDRPEFNTVAYINSLFPSEQSLCNLEAVAARCEYRVGGVEEEIQVLVRGAGGRRREGREALERARHCVLELAQRVADVSARAERSEVMVREITAEIKQLDAAKTNLTAAITALNHYHMLVGGAASLTTLTRDRRYREVVAPLQACTEVLQHFESYRDIRQVSELRDEVTRIRATLAQQILADFKEAFTGSKSGVSSRTLSDACLVVDALDDKVKQELVRWLVDVELQEYEHLFSASEPAAWLDRVERRYAWLKRHLLSFEEARATLFPPAWSLSQQVAAGFCRVTRRDLAAMMAARRRDIDVKLLLYAIQKTYNFEVLLHKRFEGTPLEGGDGGGAGGGADASAEGGGAGARSPWLGAIGACFEPYLSLYIASLDHNLRQLMDTFVRRAGEAGGGAAGAGAREGEAGAQAEGHVLASCADLFVFYKKCLVQCAQLSTGEPMRELSAVFARYLREYAGSVLQASLPRGGVGGGGGAVGGAALVNNLHSLLRDDTAAPVRYTSEEITKITSAITTAEYCLETTLHLEQKLREKIDPELREKVDLGPEQELFQKIISNCIQLLVQDLEAGCAPALASMSRAPWGSVRAVGDQSAHVSALLATLRAAVPPLRERLAPARKYFTQVCTRFATSFATQYATALCRCRALSVAGAEQLLLDTHMLKSGLLELPAHGAAVAGRPPPATYTRLVLRTMGRAEMLLKMVMSPVESPLEPAAMVPRLLQLLPDCSLAELHKVLDMKGLRLTKAQLATLDAAYRQHCSEK